MKPPTKDKVAKANIEKPKQTEYGNTLSEIEIATRQMQVDPLTGAPITVPGFGSLTTSRSSQLFEATDPGYAQGSMENAMKNPLITGVAQYGLKQKPMPTGDEGKGIRSLPSSVQEKMGYDPLSQKKYK